MDSPDEIRRKFKRAVTDSDTENPVRYDKVNKPGVANLMNIYSTVTGKSFEEIEKEFAGQGYGVFKPAVADAVIERLAPIREEANRLLQDKAYLNQVYKEGAEHAAYVANRTLSKVYKKVGFYQI
jgi:tryptophanyl-tRNA synthetase